jgi:DNA helicase-2/ATP-dependent DNA helicase PcrA
MGNSLKLLNIMSYLESLNEAQREAVLNYEGPSMIIAGAGSGKTRVLTYRIAYLIEKGVDPFKILSLTFTNKAAKEMKERVEHVVGSDARNLWMGTFHSVFSRILRTEAERLGYTQNFTIYDTDDSRNLIKQILKEQDLDDKIYKPSVVHNRISGAKNRLISSEEYTKNPAFYTDDAANGKPRMGELYQRYQERLFKASAMDFDDLLVNTYKLLKNNPDILNKYQDRFRYILVDEFQDTNIAQYSITKLLAARFRNVSVVGDDAQSIYAFRGADISNILNFEKDYPELRVFKLEQNYRSTSTIVEAANSIIKRNKAQLPKNVWTANPEGDLIPVIKASSDNEEGRLVASSIFDAKSQKQLRNKDFAILYRTNAQSRAFEEALRRLNIRYQIIGGLSFYQRKEIKDVLAYLRFIANPSDEQSLRRIINYPKRGIGDTTVNKLFVVAEEQGASIWDVVTHARQALDGKVPAQLGVFVEQMELFMRMVGMKDAWELTQEIAKATGLLKELFEDKSSEGLSRYENVQELLNGIKEFVDQPDREDKGLGAFLQEVSLLTDADSKDPDADSVSMMTIHSAKGLEFSHVYIVGLEEELFPSGMMLQSRADLEEERRLFYVAITRARDQLHLSYAVSRYRFGKLTHAEPSRFLSELDGKHLKVISPVARIPEPIGNSAIGVTPAKNLVRKPAVNKTSYVAPADFVASDTSGLKEGMRVEHPKFGFGVVKSTDFAGSDRKAVIHFEELGEKTLILSFAKLRIHD